MILSKKIPASWQLGREMRLCDVQRLHGAVERAKALDLEGPGFKSQLSHFLAVCMWTVILCLLS